MNIRISHPSLHPFLEVRSEGRVVFSDGVLESWGGSLDEGVLTLTGVFANEVYFNQIRLHPGSDPSSFPVTFRFEISLDGKIWEPILKETGFTVGPVAPQWIFPLIKARYIKLVVTGDQGKEQISTGRFEVLIAGIVGIKTSSELDRLWVKENLIDGRSEYGWSSALRSRNQEESIELDLGSVNRVSEIRLLSKNDKETFFPVSFRVLFSDDHITWHHLIEENGFFAEPATWYRWRFLPLNIRYLMIQIRENARTREGKYLSQIVEVELYATADPVERQERGLPEPVPHASVLRSGIVRLAMDGEVKEGVVVQAHDRRLRPATTDWKGIVELAQDGEDREGVVVQGNDRRLKLASEDMPGIVRLARNREQRAGHAVQASDDRLKKATVDSDGVVELAEPGEDRAGVVVQGNDPRLKYATEKSPGIVKLAPDGAVDPGLAVQASDHRLRLATTETEGILRFARAGEQADFAAVQGSDPRLLDATTERKGIVELAMDGEDREGVVVQGNDRRLRLATEELPGIVRLAPAGSEKSGLAVQASDPRLSDARPPLPHSHEYAAIDHDFNSHPGMIRLERTTGKRYEGHVPPPVDHAPVFGINTGEGAGVAGRGHVEGVIGFGHHHGLRGISDKGSGTVGQSFSGAGGYFSSAQSYDIVAASEGADAPGLYVGGFGRLRGALYAGSQAIGAAIAVSLPLKDADVVLPGDVLIASVTDGMVQKCQHRCSPKVVGIAVENAAIVLGMPDESFPSVSQPFLRPEGRVLVAVAGVVLARVSAEAGPVEPGDLLVSSFQPGCLEKLSLRDGGAEPGRIVARSLGTVKKGEALIQVVLRS
jgi:hypothetical protein